MLAPSGLGTVLSVWAHPDDDVFLAGGVMAAAARAGQRVECVLATAGEHGTDDPQTWPPHVLSEVRRREAAAAMAELGLGPHRWLGYVDGTLASVDTDEATARITGIIDEVRPDTILTFGPDGMTFHQDHITVGIWTRRAWEKTGRRARLLTAAVTRAHVEEWSDKYEEWDVYMTDERPEGVREEDLALALDLDDGLLGRKMAALRVMPSQTKAVFDGLGEETFALLNRSEWFVAVPRS
ncbi:MAG: PIG-L family deacetylase [Acidimicrobiia bacterium]